MSFKRSSQFRNTIHAPAIGRSLSVIAEGGKTYHGGCWLHFTLVRDKYVGWIDGKVADLPEEKLDDWYWYDHDMIDQQWLELTLLELVAQGMTTEEGSQKVLDTLFWRLVVKPKAEWFFKHLPESHWMRRQ